jgi:FixJ family two-component response regulator
MNGLQLFAKIKQSVPFVSVIFVTGRADMSIGVRAMREGAIDCLEKPIDDATLLNAMRRGTDLARIGRAEHMRRVELAELERTLTPREHEVFALITNGLLNKQVGAELGPTEQTIKRHRGRVKVSVTAATPGCETIRNPVTP